MFLVLAYGARIAPNVCDVHARCFWRKLQNISQRGASSQRDGNTLWLLFKGKLTLEF